MRPSVHALFGSTAIDRAEGRTLEPVAGPITFRLSGRRRSGRNGLLTNFLERRLLHHTLETLLLALDPVLDPGTVVGKKARDPENFLSG
jgi:hypothetical protein